VKILQKVPKRDPPKLLQTHEPQWKNRPLIQSNRCDLATCDKITLKYFNMNRLRLNQGFGQSGPVKVSSVRQGSCESLAQPIGTVL
jgi:hypothetical protein